MSQARHARSSSKKCRLQVEWLEGRQVLSSLGSLHRAAAPIAISELVDEAKPPKTIVHQAHEVKEAASKHVLKHNETLETLSNSPAAPLVETADKELKHVDSLAQQEISKADDLLPKATNISHVLDKADKLLDDSVKETTKLADSVLRSESLTTVRDLVQSQKQEIVKRIEESVDTIADGSPRLPQLPDAGSDQAQVGLKPKPISGGAMLDLAFAASRSPLAAGDNNGELFGRHPIDAGRLGHAVDADQEYEDAGSRLFAHDNPEGLDLFSTRKETASATILAFLAKLDGMVGNDGDGMGNPLDSTLSGGPALEGLALDSAITRFFAQLDALGRELVNTLTANGLTPWIVGIGLGMMSMELARRRANLRRAALAAASSGWAPGLPLPGAYE